MQIAVDGPAGSGKSTVSKIIAERCGITYMDTGAMYRSAAWLMMEYNLDYPSLYRLLKGVTFEFGDNGKTLVLRYDWEGPQKIDVTDKIRTPEVTSRVSEVSALAEVRKILTAKQQEVAVCHDVVMDGRDIGTVVLPLAELKFFLNATPEIRAERRCLEWQEKGTPANYAEVLADIKRRDEIDSTRDVAPLKKSSDAVEIDTSCLTIDEVTAIIYAAVKELRKETGKP